MYACVRITRQFDPGRVVPRRPDPEHVGELAELETRRAATVLVATSCIASGSPCIASGSLVPPSPSCPRCQLSAAKIVRAFFKIQNGGSSLFLQSAATASAAENDFVSLRHLLYSIYYVYYIDRPSLFSPGLGREQDSNVCFGPRSFRASS